MRLRRSSECGGRHPIWESYRQLGRPVARCESTGTANYQGARHGPHRADCGRVAVTRRSAAQVQAPDANGGRCPPAWVHRGSSIRVRERIAIAELPEAIAADAESDADRTPSLADRGLDPALLAATPNRSSWSSRDFKPTPSSVGRGRGPAMESRWKRTARSPHSTATQRCARGPADGRGKGSLQIVSRIARRWVTECRTAAGTARTRFQVGPGFTVESPCELGGAVSITTLYTLTPTQSFPGNGAGG